MRSQIANVFCAPGGSNSLRGAVRDTEDVLNDMEVGVGAPHYTLLVLRRNFQANIDPPLSFDMKVVDNIVRTQKFSERGGRGKGSGRMSIRGFDAPNLVEKNKAVTPRDAIFGQCSSNRIAERSYKPVWKRLRLKRQRAVLASGSKHLRGIARWPFSGSVRSKIFNSWTEAFLVERSEMFFFDKG